MTDVLSFDALNSEAQIENVQRGKIKIFLEGRDDQTLFGVYWFPEYQEWFDFLTPEAENAAGQNGCKGVVDAVANKRTDHAIAYGILDRDALLREKNWDLLFEADDNAFASAKPFGEFIFVTSAYEIESYLLSKNHIARWFRLHSSRWKQPEHRLDDTQVMNFVSVECDHAAYMVPYDAACMVLGLKKLPEGFACDKYDQKFIDAITEKLGSLDKWSHEAVAELMDDIGVRLEKARMHFTGENTVLDFAARFLDPKRILIRLSANHYLGDKWRLVAVISEFSTAEKTSFRPAEIANFLDTLKEEAFFAI